MGKHDACKDHGRTVMMDKRGNLICLACGRPI